MAMPLDNHLNLLIVLFAIFIISLGLLSIVLDILDRRSGAWRQLASIRNEVTQLTEMTNSASSQLSAVANAVIAAVTEINSRLNKLDEVKVVYAQQAETPNQLIHENNSIIQKTIQNAPGVADRLDDVSNPEASMSSQFFQLQTKIDCSATLAKNEYMDRIRAIESSLVSIERSVEALSKAMNLQATELDEVYSELRSRYS
jgi:chromosome segregation ATPase